MVDCRESKGRYRHDQVRGRWVSYNDDRVFVSTVAETDNEDEDTSSKALKYFKLRNKDREKLSWDDEYLSLTEVNDLSRRARAGSPSRLARSPSHASSTSCSRQLWGRCRVRKARLSCDRRLRRGSLSTSRMCWTARVSNCPSGSRQIGKSFRNEITPRNFTFRSREFEQMEIEFFCHPERSREWYQYWRDRRMQWYQDLGLAGDRLQLREHDADELSHYSTGTADIEYAFPFLPPGSFGELEGIAHRGDFDLRSHMEGKLDPATRPLELEKDDNGKPKWRGSGKDLSYRDETTNEKFVPHVIEPSAGVDRSALAFLCEAFTIDEAPDENGKMQTRTVMKLHPRLAPIKAAVFPLVKKDGMPETAKEIYLAPEAAHECLLRRERRCRPTLSATGRSRHTVLRDGRRSDGGRQHRDHSRSRFAGTMARSRGPGRDRNPTTRRALSIVVVTLRVTKS